MERVTIGKARLPSFLEALRDEYRVVAPQRWDPRTSCSTISRRARARLANARSLSLLFPGARAC
jgi:hypothetical protein